MTILYIDNLGILRRWSPIPWYDKLSAKEKKKEDDKRAKWDTGLRLATRKEILKDIRKKMKNKKSKKSKAKK